MARCLRLGLTAAVLLAMAVAATASSRELKQTCPIWKCASGCQLEDQMAGGVRRWVCGTCQSSYRLLSNKRACGKWQAWPCLASHALRFDQTAACSLAAIRQWPHILASAHIHLLVS